MDDRERWNARHRSACGVPAPCDALRAAEPHLPPRGVALDLACGRGGNALWLARRGLATRAWDISDAAIAQLRERARRERLAVEARTRDVARHPPASASCDLLVVSHFLHRPILPRLAAAVRPDGLLVYQTFLAGHAGPGPRNPDYLLRPGELQALCEGWECLRAREAGGQAQWVARKPGVTDTGTPG